MQRKTVEEYIAAAPATQQGALRELREMIRAAIPRAEEGIGSAGFPVYTLASAWTAGFASRKKGPMLYIMRTDVLDRHEAALGTLRSGRSCIDYVPGKRLDAAALKALARQMLEEAGST